MVEIDGSIGEGGGQVLRTSLSLSMLTGKPFRIRNIRAGRRKPGLLRQHLTAVTASAEICSAKIKGAEIGSSTLKFTPDKVRPGDYIFSIGSAGSTSLVLQTLLPALILADSPSTLVIEGGTHNPMAPPFDFLQHSFMPLISRMGPQVNAILDRPGFYPAGGGRIRVNISPVAELAPLNLIKRGGLRSIQAQVVISGLDQQIAKREIKVIREQLELDRDHAVMRDLGTEYGPGNLALVNVASDALTVVLCSFGEKNTRAETVAAGVCAQAKAYLRSDAAVDRCLADQLLIPFSLSPGSRFSTLDPSSHTLTNAAVIKSFLDVDIRYVEISDGLFEFHFGS
ncbi:MAG: RNA 3'-terminal phosphate cyclase [Bdellovibrionales bacterium]|nr:RNA 3'-terminal phosphate cyclase [Bdellovibrionales bacterium]